MECNHTTQEGYPAVELDESNNVIRCALCNKEIELGADEIRRLIQTSIHLADKNIEIIFTHKDRYNYEKPIYELSIHDDIYLDGDIIEHTCYKTFNNFNIALIIKHENISNAVCKMVVIIKQNEKDDEHIRSAVILEYLSPEVLQLIL